MKKKVEISDTVPGVPVGGFVEEFCTKPQFDEDGVQSSAGIGRDGKEYGDPTPMAPPVGLHPPEDLMSMIRRMVHHEEFNRIADAEGFDTFEEAGDYDLADDGDFMDELTPYEAMFYPPDERKTDPTATMVEINSGRVIPKPQVPAPAGEAPKTDAGAAPPTNTST